MTGHTPGKWAYATGPALNSRYHVVNAGETMVCECYEGPDSEQEANARLIASAPEVVAERDRLREINGELVAALSGVMLVCGSTGDSFQDFEEQAAAFQRETGKMRPGKDVPAAAADLGATPEEFRAWVQNKLAAGRAALARAKEG